MREYTTLPTAPTATNTKKITIDLKGYKIYQNNPLLITNNSELTLMSSEDGGRVIVNTGYMIDNYGKLTMTSGIYETKVSTAIISNNTNADLIINGADIQSYETRLINNDGKLTMTSGSIHVTRTNFDNSKVNEILIYNDVNGEISISGGNFSFIGNGALIDNYNKVTITDGVFDLYGRHTATNNTQDYEVTKLIVNESSGTATITGGEYGTTGKVGRLIENSGTARIENVTSKFYATVINSGTIELINDTMDNMSTIRHSYYGSNIPIRSYIYNSGNMTITGGLYKGSDNNTILYNTSNGIMSIDGTEFEFGNFVSTYCSGWVLNGNSSTTLNNVTIKDNRNQASASTISIEGAANLDITLSIIYGLKYKFTGSVDYYLPATIRDYSSGNVNITDSTITASAFEAINNIGSGTLTIDNVTASSEKGLVNRSSGTNNLINSNITSTNGNCISNIGSGTINIISGTYTSTTENGIYEDATGIVNEVNKVVYQVLLIL